MDLLERDHTLGLRHPWEQARCRFFCELILTLPLRAHGESLRILDAGAGDGWFSTQLHGRLAMPHAIDCWDIHYSQEDLEAFALSASAAISSRKEHPEGRYDLLVLLDVLEHIEDDGSFLGDLVENHLHPGAYVVVSVPAWQALFSEHDAALKHFRRYAPGHCNRLVEESGLHIERKGGLFHSLILPRMLTKIRERLRPSSHGEAPRNLNSWRGGALSTRLVVSALGLDNRLSRALSLRGLDMPGLSWWCLSQRP